MSAGMRNVRWREIVLRTPYMTRSTRTMYSNMSELNANPPGPMAGKKQQELNWRPILDGMVWTGMVWYGMVW